MAKVCNEANRQRSSFAAQIDGARDAREEQTMRDFNRDGRATNSNQRPDNTTTKDYGRGSPPPEVTRTAAQDRGNVIHARATQKSRDRGPER